MNKVFWAVLITALLVAGGPLIAQNSGGFSGSFLRLGLGARALGMGQAQVAAADDGYGLFYNPAALPNVERRRFSASYNHMSLDRQFNYIGIAVPLPPLAGASIGWINSGVNDIRAYDSNGQDIGEIGHGLNAFYFSFGVKPIALAQADNQLTGLPSDFLNIGLTVKFLSENVTDEDDFDYSGSGLGLDLGVLLKPHANISIGYQVKDINASLESNTSDIFDRGVTLDNKFPISQRVGVFYQTPWEWARVAYDFEWNDAGREEQHFGVELLSDIAIGRLGWDDDRFTLGGGLSFKAYKKSNMILDYAFLNSVEDEGISHVFSWQFLF